MGDLADPISHAIDVHLVGVDRPFGGFGVGGLALGLELRDAVERVAAGEHGPRLALRRLLARANRFRLGLEQDDHARLPHEPPVLRVDGHPAAGGDDGGVLVADLRQRLAFEGSEGGLTVGLEDLGDRPSRPPLDPLIEIDERHPHPLRRKPPRGALARIRKPNQKQMPHRLLKPSPGLTGHLQEYRPPTRPANGDLFRAPLGGEAGGYGGFLARLPHC